MLRKAEEVMSIKFNCRLTSPHTFGCPRNTEPRIECLMAYANATIQHDRNIASLLSHVKYFPSSLLERIGKYSRFLFPSVLVSSARSFGLAAKLS